MNTELISQFQSLFKSPKKVVIVGHKNPDGDALGASLGLYWFLLSQGHQVTVVMPNDFPEFLKWMPGSDDILNFEYQGHEVSTCLNNADIICTLDFNDLSRVGTLESLLRSSDKALVMIDHHQQPSDYAVLTWSDPKMSSTSEMIAHLIEAWTGWSGLSKAMATNLYTGIMTDTGSFRFSATTAKTHEVVAKLIDAGANHTQIHQAVYDNQSPGRLKLLARALANMEIKSSWQTAYTFLSQNDLDQCNFKKGDTEGFVNYALQLQGIKFAIIFIENQNEQLIKISFRSTGDFSVNEFARNHFDGGGHTNAAGGRYNGRLSEAIDHLLTELPKYKEQLYEIE
jgi:phosphoesterase RecJ-like protein